ncbi:MAG: hypothetical protein Roseis2KO_44620 [Roseivirga sp.]
MLHGLNKFRVATLIIVLFAGCVQLKAQQLEIALYGAKLDADEANHVQESLKFQIEFYNTLFGDTIRENMRLRVFGKRTEFEAYASKRIDQVSINTIGGYYSPAEDEFVIHKTEDKKQFLEVYSHELSHGILSKKVPRRVPTWLNEGLASFFGTIIFYKDSVKSEVSGRMMRQAYPNMRSKSNLRKFLMKPYGDFHKMRSGTSYGLSWCIVNFLYFEKIDQFKAIILEISKGRKTLETIEKLYPGGFDKFHSELKAYYRSMIF